MKSLFAAAAAALCLTSCAPDRELAFATTGDIDLNHPAGYETGTDTVTGKMPCSDSLRLAEYISGAAGDAMRKAGPNCVALRNVSVEVHDAVRVEGSFFLLPHIYVKGTPVYKK